MKQAENVIAASVLSRLQSNEIKCRIVYDRYTGAVAEVYVDYGDGIEHPITEEQMRDFFNVMRALEIARE